MTAFVFSFVKPVASDVVSSPIIAICKAPTDISTRLISSDAVSPCFCVNPLVSTTAPSTSITMMFGFRLNLLPPDVAPKTVPSQMLEVAFHLRFL
nr:MAG TPA: hypothetical protein [Caudoviricetes sp.]